MLRLCPTFFVLSFTLVQQVVEEAPLFGFEQEYTMLSKGSGLVLGWPEGGYPAPQGPFYCGVGTNSVFGRPLAEAHMEACLEAGLTISGINAEVRKVPGSSPGGCGKKPKHFLTVWRMLR